MCEAEVFEGVDVVLGDVMDARCRGDGIGDLLGTNEMNDGGRGAVGVVADVIGVGVLEGVVRVEVCDLDELIGVTGFEDIFKRIDGIEEVIEVEQCVGDDAKCGAAFCGGEFEEFIELIEDLVDGFFKSGSRAGVNIHKPLCMWCTCKGAEVQVDDDLFKPACGLLEEDGGVGHNLCGGDGEGVVMDVCELSGDLPEFTTSFDAL